MNNTVTIQSIFLYAEMSIPKSMQKSIKFPNRLDSIIFSK